MPLPMKALRYGQLEFKTAGEAVPTSGHVVDTVEFLDADGERKTGFYKPLGATYPALLAKFAVASSVIMRMFVGKRVAEDRLVFDDNGNITGTVSIACPGYKPFYCAGKNLPANPAEAEQVCPSVETLLQHNIAELLILLWMCKEDDAHPGNLSLLFSIDRDMTYYHHTSIIKGFRYTDGLLAKLPQVAMILKGSQLDNIPNNVGGNHWPANGVPGNGNIFKLFASRESFQKLAENRPFLTKTGPITFQEQMFEAILKTLVNYDPEMLRAKLTDYFGDINLDFSSLGSEKSEKLSQMDENLYNTKTDAEPFANFWMQFFAKEYDEISRACIFYTGCEKNQSGVRVTGFRKFLQFRPSAFRNVIAWAKEQNMQAGQTWFRQLCKQGNDLLQLTGKNVPEDNAIESNKLYLYVLESGKLECATKDNEGHVERLKLNNIHFNNFNDFVQVVLDPSKKLNDSQIGELFNVISQRPASSSENTPANLSEELKSSIDAYRIPIGSYYDFDKMEQRYHQVWRDTHILMIQESIFTSKLLINKLLNELRIRPLTLALSARPALKTDDANLTNAWQIIPDEEFLKDSLPFTNCDQANDLQKGLDALWNFTKEIIICGRHYYTLPWSKLSLEDNLTFCREISEIIHKYQSNIRKHLTNTPWVKEYDTIVSDLEQFYCEIKLTRHNIAADTPFDTVKTNYPALLKRKHTDVEIVNACLKALFDWAEKAEKTEKDKDEGKKSKFYASIAQIIHDYETPSYILANRSRGSEITAYLKESTEGGANKLAYILSTGGQESTSLNTQLIKHLIPLMLENTVAQVDVNLTSVHDACQYGKFQNFFYTNKAIHYAQTDPRFTHLYSKSASDKINEAMYRYVGTSEYVLLKIASDPLLMPYDNIGKLLNNRSGVIFYNEKFYYANHKSESIELISLEKAEKKEEITKLKALFAPLKIDICKMAVADSIEARLISSLQGHPQSLSRVQFKKVVMEELDKYDPSSWRSSLFNFRERRVEVNGYFEQGKNFSNQQILAFLFTKGNIESTSLNTKLFKRILTEMQSSIHKDEAKKSDPDFNLVSQIKIKSETQFQHFLNTIQPAAKDKSNALSISMKSSVQKKSVEIPAIENENMFAN